MSGIIIAGEKLKLFEFLQTTCEYIGYDDEWRDRFWCDLLQNTLVYNEFLYWADHQDFLMAAKVNGNTIIDILVWEMRKYNVRTDRGKNGSDCNKIAMVMDAFREMLDAVNNGEKLTSDMENKNGMDRL